MTIDQIQLLALSRIAIHPDEKISNVLLTRAIQWEKVFEEAKKQSLLGIALLGFKRWSTSETVSKDESPLDDELFAKWYGLAEKIRQRNLLLNKRTSQVCHNFAKDGFRTSIMKGQGNALLYGPDLMLLRSPGDIDVWVEGGFRRVYDYVMKVSPTNHVSEKDMAFNVFNDVKVEVHYLPLIMRNPFMNRRLQVFFSSQEESCFSNYVKLPFFDSEGNEVLIDAKITTTAFNLVHQLAHIHRHLFAVGVGIRHVMDYYFQLVNAEKTMSQEQKSEVLRVVKSLGLERLAKALIWVLTEYLGLPSSSKMWDPNKLDGEFLLEEMFKTGNFGQGDEILSSADKKRSFDSLLYVLKHNWAMSRFDRTDWFWGPVARINSYFWRSRNRFFE